VEIAGNAGPEGMSERCRVPMIHPVPPDLPPMGMRPLVAAKAAARSAQISHLPITWLLNRFWPGWESSREFVG
jgi:hypothetical protein